VIYHVAAHVNHLLPYSELKATNVTGTLNIISFACTKVPKQLHYVSCISVCSVVGTTKEADVRDFFDQE